jgi:hypothetical protein
MFMTKATNLSTAAVLLAVFALGCGGSAPSTMQACQDLANAQCTKRLSCSNSQNTAGASIVHTFGSLENCVMQETLACTNGLSAPKTGNNAALVESCATAYSTYSCNDFFNNNPPSVCAPTGPGANGTACSFNAQCTSGYCSGTKNALCGSCAVAPSAGDSCASSSCGHGQSCVASTEQCEPVGSAASSCTDDTPCGNGLSCVGNDTATSTPGTCMAAVAQLSASCGGAMAGCNGTEGLFCAGASGAKTCIAITYVGDGMPCGDISASEHVECIAGGCYTTTGSAGTGDTGTCRADVTDGSPCDTALGPACQTPARCVLAGTGTSGTCTAPVSTSCG